MGVDTVAAMPLHAAPPPEVGVDPASPDVLAPESSPAAPPASTPELEPEPDPAPDPEPAVDPSARRPLSAGDPDSPLPQATRASATTHPIERIRTPVMRSGYRRTGLRESPYRLRRNGNRRSAKRQGRRFIEE
jgi:hypothetical protein